MNDKILYASLVSVIPTLVLLAYIYYRDRVEKEPVGLLFALFGGGAISFLPAFYLSKGLALLTDGWFERSFDVNGMVHYADGTAKVLHGGLYSFVCVALVCEALKWLVLFLLTRKNKNFNCLFDGILYSVFVSLGFGVLESLRYALVDGWDSLLFRFFSSVPACFFYGVISGVFYTLWFVLKRAAKKEKQLLKEGKIEKRKINSPLYWLILSFAAPTLVHGFAEFSDWMGTKGFAVAHYVLLGLLYLVCFFLVWQFSRWDDEVHDITVKVLKKKHPHLKGDPELKELTPGEEAAQ